MLRAVLGRNGVVTGQVESSNEDWHYSFNINNSGEITKPSVVEVKANLYLMLWFIMALLPTKWLILLRRRLIPSV